jgi:iron(III) transport system ATP-binding protein
VSTVSLDGLTKQFKNLTAVRDVTLDIRSGEFFSILGPSGCGKTTLLRMIAGFDKPSRGRILLDGEDVTLISPQRRNIGMVFQNYALFPHMTVFQNVAFGLETKRLPESQIRPAVERILAAVRLSNKIDVPVPNLSGGEQQRVAVARALVVEPKVLLFDEPLSNLDVGLRAKTREEIRSLQRATGITSVYVTHDQGEAMSMSDRIAVMRAGSIEQVGTPSELYDAPFSPFVAEFVGSSNLLTGSVISSERILRVNDGTMPLPPAVAASARGRVTIAVKPEAIRLLPNGEGAAFSATVEGKEYHGFTTNFVVRAIGLRLQVMAPSSGLTKRIEPGDRVGVEIDWSGATVFGEG